MPLFSALRAGYKNLAFPDFIRLTAFSERSMTSRILHPLLSLFSPVACQVAYLKAENKILSKISSRWRPKMIHAHSCSWTSQVDLSHTRDGTYAHFFLGRREIGHGLSYLLDCSGRKPSR